METITRDRQIESLKMQLALSHQVCRSLAEEFNAGTLSVDEKAEIAYRLDKARKECHNLRLAIESLEAHSKPLEAGVANSGIA